MCHSGVSQNPVATNYIKSIVTTWIPDEDFVNAKALTKSSSGMTYDEKGDIPKRY